MARKSSSPAGTARGTRQHLKPHNSLPDNTAAAVEASDLAGSNSLADLAARIQAEHEASALSLRRGAEHAFKAGELLIEAKATLQHGQWLPWLREHCGISERTAQLYMRCAKNRPEIEAANAQLIADLTLNEAAALLMLSADVRKLLSLTKTMTEMEGEELISFCVENDIAMLSGNIFGAPEPTDQERIEWHLFVLWLAREEGYSVEGSWNHMDWVQSRGTLLADWMAPNPLRDAWMPIPRQSIDHWNAFLAANRHRSLDDVAVELKTLDADRARLEQRPRRRRSRRAAP
jgi:hypothetical protein